MDQFHIIIQSLIEVKEKFSYNLRSNDDLLLAPPTFKSKKTIGDRAFQNGCVDSMEQTSKCIKDGNKLEAF